MCKQRRLRSACASAQADLSLPCSWKHSKDQEESMQNRSVAHNQLHKCTFLSFHCQHMLQGTFKHETAHFLLSITAALINIYFEIKYHNCVLCTVYCFHSNCFHSNHSVQRSVEENSHHNLHNHKYTDHYCRCSN